MKRGICIKIMSSRKLPKSGGTNQHSIKSFINKNSVAEIQERAKQIGLSLNQDREKSTLELQERVKHILTYFNPKQEREKL